MIYFKAPYFDFNGLIVMPDDADPLQFYYFPMYPRLATNPDGTPSFLFVKFKQDKPVPPGVEAGGGFLNFDVDLHVEPDALDEAKRQIKTELQLNGDPRLVPLEYRSGSTKLIFLDTPPGPAPAPTTGTTPAPAPAPAPPPMGTGLTFVESASYSATPALYGDNRTAFSVALSAQGATLVEQCLDAPTFLAGVVYDLTFVGLRPAYNVSLVVDWDRVYDWVENEFHASVKLPYVTLQTDIDAATEKLIENRTIQINVKNYAAGTPDADIVKEKDAAVDFVKKMVTDAFFQPSIPLKGITGGDSGNKTIAAIQAATSPVSMGYTRKSISRQDVKTLNVDLSEQDAMEVHIVPQGHLSGLADALKSYPRENFVKEVDLNDPFFQRVAVDVASSPVFATDGIDQITANFAYAGTNAVPHALTFNAAANAGNVSWELDQSIGWTYTYDVQVSFKPDGGAGSTLVVSGRPETAHTPRITIDPHKYYTLARVDVQAVSIVWDRYSQILVELAYDDAAVPAGYQESIVLTAAAKSGSWSFRPSDGSKSTYRYRTTYYPTSGTPIIVDWQPSIKPTIVISDVESTLKILLTTNLDFTKVSRALVTLDYEDPTNHISQTDAFSLTGDAPLFTWSVPIIDRNKRDYTYAVIVQYADHSSKTLPPVPTNAPVLNVTDTYMRKMQVAVSANGQTFDQANLDHVDVVMLYDDAPNKSHAAQTITLRSASDTGTFAYTVFDPAKDAYSYAVTYYGKDGFNQQVAAKMSDQATLAIAIGTAAPV